MGRTSSKTWQASKQNDCGHIHNLTTLSSQKEEKVATMPMMIKLKFTFKEGKREEFVENQGALMKITQEYAGVIVFHADYPEGENYSEFTWVYADDEVFVAHLANEKGKEPLGKLVGASEKIECRCWGNPNEQSKTLLAGFGSTYHESGENSIVLNPDHALHGSLG
jgi:quinol monooxygenase YgiN